MGRGILWLVLPNFCPSCRFLFMIIFSLSFLSLLFLLFLVLLVLILLFLLFLPLILFIIFLLFVLSFLFCFSSFSSLSSLSSLSSISCLSSISRFFRPLLSLQSFCFYYCLSLFFFHLLSVSRPYFGQQPWQCSCCFLFFSAGRGVGGGDFNLFLAPHRVWPLTCGDDIMDNSSPASAIIIQTD